MIRSLTGLPVAVCILALAAAASFPSAVASISETRTASTSEAHARSFFESSVTRSLTFEERLAAERAIQRVYWNHRIWPSQNPKPKPPLDHVMPASTLRAKVEDYLKKSSALEKLWNHPITAEQLQAEIDRMTRATHQPEVLRELFNALGNDPVRIAECLARPSLVDRQIQSWYARDGRFHDALRQKAEAALPQDRTVERMVQLGGEYSVARWERGGEKGEVQSPSDPSPGVVRLDSAGWNRLLERLRSRLGNGRFQHGMAADLPIRTLGPLVEDDKSFSVTTVLEQGEDQVTTATVSWRKTPFDAWWREQSRSIRADLAMPEARYSLSLPTLDVCTNDTWAPTMAVQDPGERAEHTAVWTGSEMLIWGGYSGYSEGLSGDVVRYNPSTDTWTESDPLGAPSSSAPYGRIGHTAVWTGTKMIVWGGLDYTGSPVNTGGVYNLATNTWTATSTGANVPSARHGATAVWTGSFMVVWGGTDDSTYPAAGGRYNPSSNTWASTAVTGAPTGRSGHTAVWTGNQMIVWGGEGLSYNCTCSNDASLGCTTNTQCRFCFSDHSIPCTSNTQCAAVGGPCGTQGTCVGSGCAVTITRLNTGSRYSPTTNSWTATSTGTGTPSPRDAHRAVWTGSEMIVWGGTDGTSPLQTGSRYNPTSNTWVATNNTGAVPSARIEHTAVWTGSEMIVWGGTDGTSPLGTGGRYTPSSDTWSATSTAGAAPSARDEHSAVWTGSEMIVWGGEGNLLENTGGRYNPVSNTWVATPTGVPASFGHSTVWTGSEMIVFGGYNSVDGDLDTGLRYDPMTDSWASIARSSSTPRAAYAHTAVWTGTEMIVWGGLDGSSLVQTGGRYDPLTDSWTPTSTTGAPSGRDRHNAVWTGSEMIVWGGLDPHFANTGGRYDPSTDTWSATSTTGPVPTGRSFFSTVWTGSEMIVWGGGSDDGFANTGGRYDPLTDSWTPTSTGPNVPEIRYGQATAWTGSRMVVWGGYNYDTHWLNTGGRYDPTTDSWTPTSTGTGVPPAAWASTAVWTGNEVIVWGGEWENGLPDTNTGGRYNPAGDFWTPTSTGANVPAGRKHNGAVATGSEMIIWGGSDSDYGTFNSGGLYCYACAATTWYRDADGDGYGDPAMSVSSCSQHPGYVAVSGDCNDACATCHSGALEICNDSLDNDCNGTTDDASPPSAIPALLVGEPAMGTAHLAWSAVPGTSGYDIVRGSLVALHTSGGDFAVATNVCLENDFAATTRNDADVPGVGQGFWYLIRTENCGGPASYDEGALSQVGSRDAEIQASGYACP